MYFKKLNSKDKNEPQSERQTKNSERVLPIPFKIDDEIDDQPIGLNQFLMNVKALESTPDPNHGIGRDWMNSEFKYPISYVNQHHSRPYFKEASRNKAESNTWCIPKYKLDDSQASNIDLNEWKHDEQKEYEESSDQSYMHDGDMSSDKSSKEIWQPEKFKTEPIPKTYEKEGFTENKNLSEKKSENEEEEKVNNSKYQGFSAKNPKEEANINNEVVKFIKYEELNMENLQSHLQKPFSENHSQSNEDDSDFSSREQDENKNERHDCELKKKNVQNIKNVYDLIENCVIPKWKEYMKSKAEKHHLNINKRPRGDTFRKKILRDMREFYRILFRKRFIVSEYKTIEGIRECMITLFDEIGLPLDDEGQDNFELFRYIHQTHQHIRSKLKLNNQSQESSCIFQVIENYNEINFTKFLKHPLCSRMFYFVFKNYPHHYYPQIKDAEFKRSNKRSKKSGKNIDYRKQVMTIIKLLLNCYKRMTKPEHINRIDYLFN